MCTEAKIKIVTETIYICEKEKEKDEKVEVEVEQVAEETPNKDYCITLGVCKLLLVLVTMRIMV